MLSLYLEINLVKEIKKENHIHENSKCPWSRFQNTNMINGNKRYKNVTLSAMTEFIL